MCLPDGATSSAGLLFPIGPMNPHRHLDLARRLGHPIRQGIPAVAVLASEGRLIKATEGGALSSATSMGDRKVLEVFETLGPGG